MCYIENDIVIANFGQDGDGKMRIKGIILSCLIACSLPLLSAAQTSRETEAEQDIQSGKQAQAQGDYALAAADYAAAVKLMPEVAELYGNLGIAYYLEKDYDKAIAAFQQALKRKPALEGSNLYLGMAFIRTGRFAESIKPLQKALSINPKIREAYINLTPAIMRWERVRKRCKCCSMRRRFFPTNKRFFTHWEACITN